MGNAIVIGLRQGLIDAGVPVHYETELRELLVEDGRVLHDRLARMRVDEEDILEAAEKVEGFIAGETRESFRSNDEKVYAVIRGLEIIGEAAKHIPEDVRQQYQEIPWRSMSGMRDVLIHHYFGIDVDHIWTTVSRDLPPLRHSIRAMIDSETKP
jgi:uncharacterized protein with HEPN domain